MAKTTDRFNEYARLGAALRRTEILAELHAIDKAFPELWFQKARTAALLEDERFASDVGAGGWRRRASRAHAAQETEAHASREEVHQRADEEILGGTQEEGSLIAASARRSRLPCWRRVPQDFAGDVRSSMRAAF